MPIDHGGADIFVAEQCLYGTHVIATFQEMGRKAVSQGLATAALLNTRSAYSVLDGLLEHRFRHMLSAFKS
jgi:hypothetical protein